MLSQKKFILILKKTLRNQITNHNQIINQDKKEKINNKLFDEENLYKNDWIFEYTQIIILHQ